ncbi:MAG TPA: lysylphosphatidylglycerol synthase transmembrane domain-containing protein [Candidatus Nanoarchaeia archaeon]|nr:lysylphosphatidylglycerol synthase transmembrane domain-containing protein [Candidatus Nanoarchaeia archaeon]
MNDKTLKIIKKVIQYAIGPLILFVLFYQVGFTKIIQTLSTIKPLYFIYAFFWFIFSTAIAAWNVKIVLTPLKKISWKKYLPYFLKSRVTSLILPGRVGEFSLAFFLKKEEIPTGPGIAAIISDKLTTLFCSGMVGIISIQLIFGFQHAVTIAMYLLLIIILGLLALSAKVRSFIKRVILRRYAHHFDGFSSTLFSYVKENKWYMIKNSSVTIFRMVVIALSAQYMFLAVGVSVPLVTLFLVGGIETITTFIPLTSNGLGLKQAAGLYVFSNIGIGPDIIAARYTLGIIIQYLFGLLSIIFIKALSEQNSNENTH